jgi:hypothetical protein
MITGNELSALMLHGEGQSLDWKREFPAGLLSTSKDPQWQEGKGALLKDIVALANTPASDEAFLVCGVRDDGVRRAVVGIKGGWDPSTFQTWNRNAFDPIVKFTYGEIETPQRLRVGVFRIRRSPTYPHVAIRTIGELQEGQVWIRRGTQNGVALRGDLQLMLAPAEPFKIRRTTDPTLDRIIGEYRAMGETPTLPSLGDRDSLLAQGYRLALFPGSRREVWVGEVDGRYEHLLMLTPSPSVDKP